MNATTINDIAYLLNYINVSSSYTITDDSVIEYLAASMGIKLVKVNIWNVGFEAADNEINEQLSQINVSEWFFEPSYLTSLLNANNPRDTCEFYRKLSDIILKQYDSLLTETIRCKSMQRIQK